MKTCSLASERIGTESAFAVSPEINKLICQGFDIIKLNVGEPGANIPKAATEAAIVSLRKNQTHYTPSAGDPILRKEIAFYLTKTRGVNYCADNIIVTPGAKPVICGTFFLLVNPGEEVVYPTPSYPIYESMIDFVGGKAVPIVLSEKNDFRLDIDELIRKVGPKTKLLILNSPSNPTGGVLTKEDYQKIARLAKKYHFYILADEIYSRIAFGKNLREVSYKGNRFPTTHSIVGEEGMLQRTVLMDGFSKTYAATGLRLGFMASKIPLFSEKFLTFAINFWTCLPQPMMEAAKACLGPDQSMAQKEIRAYQEKRDIAVKMLNQIKGVSCLEPRGSFYLFPNVTAACCNLKLKDAEELRKYLLSFDKTNKKGVAVLARIHFGRRQKTETEEYIRLSFAGEKEELVEGINRIKEAIEKK